MTRYMLVAMLIAGCGSRAAAPAASSASSSSSAGYRDRIGAIELCKTTEAELLHGFGPPTRDGRLHGARVMSWILESDDVIHYLAVMLDPLGTVVDVYWDLPTEIPWTPSDQCTSAAAGAGQ